MNTLTPSVGPSDHVIGRYDARVTLVEYADYECPASARAHRVVAEVLRRMGREVRFVFRHFPLSQSHPHALAAASAAEAAGAQGQFWPMHATLFDGQQMLSNDDLLDYAHGIGLDVARFAAELRTGVHLARVMSDFRAGLRVGVSKTPTFFIDDCRFEGAIDEVSLIRALRTAAAMSA